jgi:teichuronic acid biosynthesis glycosyltransferase TuaC
MDVTKQDLIGIRQVGPRVLYVIPGADDGVCMPFARRQAASVVERGVQACSFFLRSRTSPRTLWSEFRRLRREIRDFKPHIVHAQFGTMTAFVAAVASRSPLVITFHGSDLNPTPGDWWIKSAVGRMLSHLAARYASQIICVSPQLRARIADLGDRVHTVPCGVNMKRFRPLSKPQCRATLGWDADEKIVLFNARTDPIGKRLDLAEAAIAHAKQKISNVRLHVFRGTTHPDEMPLYYSAADCLLMTSDYEGSPMVVKEAMACNLPVVSVDVGDVAARLAGVTSSKIVDRTPQSLGDALAEVIADRLPSNGRKMIQELSEEAVAARIVSIYRLAAGGEFEIVDSVDSGAHSPSAIRRRRHTAEHCLA